MAGALALAYPTPRSLVAAYAALRNVQREGPALVVNVEVGPGRRIGPTVGRRVFEAVWEGGGRGGRGGGGEADGTAAGGGGGVDGFDLDW